MKNIYKFLSGFVALSTVLTFSNSFISSAEPPPPGKGCGDEGFISEETLAKHATHFDPSVLNSSDVVTTSDENRPLENTDVDFNSSPKEVLNSSDYKSLSEVGLAHPSYMDDTKIDESIAKDGKVFELPLKELTGSVYNTLTFLYQTDVPDDFSYKEAVSQMKSYLHNLRYDDNYYPGYKASVFDWGTFLVENPKFIEIYGEPKAGDINLDGEVTSDDALIVLSHVVKIERLDYRKVDQTDLNGDGELNTEDALQILKTVVGLK